MSRMESVTQTNKSDQKHAKLIWTFGIEHRDPGENVPLWRAKWKSELFSQLLTMPKTSLCLHVLRNVTVDPDPIILFERSLIEILYWPYSHCLSVLEVAVAAAVQMNIFLGSTSAENRLKSLH